MGLPVTKAAGSVENHTPRFTEPPSQLNNQQNTNFSYWDIYFDPDPRITLWQRVAGGAALPIVGPLSLLAGCKSRGETSGVGADSSDLKNDPRPALVSVETDGGQGTGFFVKHNGRLLIVTARHNVALTQRFWVARFEGPREKTVTVIHPIVRMLAWDRSSDLAVLEVENLQDGIAALELSNTEPSRNTELVAWGTPSIPTLSGEPLRMIPTKASLHDIREEEAFDLWTEKPTTLQGKSKRLYLDGKILPGNSGGPVVDPQTGRVVGVISMGAPGISEGIATSAEAVRALLGRIPAPTPLTKAQAEETIRNLLESFLPLNDPDPDIERFVSPRELGQLLQKEISNIKTWVQEIADCTIRAKNIPPMAALLCEFYRGLIKRSEGEAEKCFKDILRCAKSDLSSNIQGLFGAQFRYEKGKSLQSVKVIEEPVKDADPNLWHVKARWSFGDKTFTERLLLEQAVGEVFVRILETDGTPVVKVEEEPRPEPRRPRRRRESSYQDPYAE